MKLYVGHICTFRRLLVQDDIEKGILWEMENNKGVMEIFLVDRECEQGPTEAELICGNETFWTQIGAFWKMIFLH